MRNNNFFQRKVSIFVRRKSVKSERAAFSRVDITALLAPRGTKHLFSSLRTYSLFLNFSTTKQKKEGSRTSAFIAENGIKASWKRASVVFRGLDGRIRRMDVGRLVRIYPSIHSQRNSKRYGSYIF